MVNKVTKMKNEIDGGKLPISDIQGLLKQSYSSVPTDYKDYTLDKTLSGKRVQVYKQNNSLNQYDSIHIVTK